MKLGRALVLSLLVLGVPDAARAQQICSAAVSAKPTFCKNPADCTGTNPVAIKNADPFTITLDVANTSTFSANPPSNPPAGKLVSGQTVKIYYSCGNSSCSAGSERAGWFTYNSATITGPAVGKASFSDDGNGYSGTLTITSDISFAQGDTSTSSLVTIFLTANNPPNMPVPTPTPLPSTSIFYSRAVTSASAFEITDGACLSGVTGGGQSSTCPFRGTPKAGAGREGETGSHVVRHSHPEGDGHGAKL